MSETLHSAALARNAIPRLLLVACHPSRPTHDLLARLGIDTQHAVQLSGRLNGADRSVALLARRESRRRGEEGSGDNNLHGRYLYSLDGRRTGSGSPYGGGIAGMGRQALAFGISLT